MNKREMLQALADKFGEKQFNLSQNAGTISGQLASNQQAVAASLNAIEQGIREVIAAIEEIENHDNFPSHPFSSHNFSEQTSKEIASLAGTYLDLDIEATLLDLAAAVGATNGIEPFRPYLVALKRVAGTALTQARNK